MKLVECYRKLLKVVFKGPYFNAQTDYIAGNGFYHEKNQIKVPSISRVKIDQFQKQAIHCVQNVLTIWFTSNNYSINYVIDS